MCNHIGCLLNENHNRTLGMHTNERIYFTYNAIAHPKIASVDKWACLLSYKWEYHRCLGSNYRVYEKLTFNPLWCRVCVCKSMKHLIKWHLTSRATIIKVNIQVNEKCLWYIQFLRKVFAYNLRTLILCKHAKIYGSSVCMHLITKMYWDSSRKRTSSQREIAPI